MKGSFQDRALPETASADRRFSLLEPKVESTHQQTRTRKSPEKLEKTRTGEPDLMKKSTFLGSTLGVLLLFSIISYSQSLVQQQNQKSNQQTTQTAATPATDPTTANPSAAENNSAATAADERNAVVENFEATAYSLRGRTASGAAASTGIIAADPRVLPIGSRVRIEAGAYSGEYVVADTGGGVRGKRIDIWTPNSREARRFGRRTVKLTVLHLGGKRGVTPTRSRAVNQARTPAPAQSQKH